MSPSGPPRPRRPSLKDVAGEAGVSFQTASKVLRGGGSVSDSTRSRIHTVADRLGYVPNDAARSLVTRRTRTIGVVVGDLSDHVIARFVTGVEQEAARQGHALVIVTVTPGSAAAERSLRSLVERQVGGVVTAAPQLEDDERLGELLRSEVMAVSIHHIAGGGVAQVGSDNRGLAAVATEHLLGLGHDRIGMVTGPTNRRVVRQRSQGWADALRRAGHAHDDVQMQAGDWLPDGGYRAATTLLRRTPDLTALYVHNDLMAVGVLHAARDLGRRVPDDLAVVGCDDDPIAAHTMPPLTTTRLPFLETGATCVQVLLASLAEPPDALPPPVLLPSRLVCRASCGCGGTTEADDDRPAPTEPM